jgi:DNA (cytosine-5)-methyltransferase 1
LAALGYDAEWHCIPASHVGAPQQRDRVWIIANPESRETWSEESNHCAIEADRGRAVATPSFRRRLGVSRRQHWHSEPEICRVADGISANVDRVAALGNAVVPQIPELIGNAILASIAADRLAA